jgi:hypothetical protein
VTDTYILDDEHRPVPVPMEEWARWYCTANRIVAQDGTRFHWVSTIFLGLDHNHFGKGPPILFETMVFEREAEIREFGGKLFPARDSLDMWRYASWDEAEAGHRATVKRLKKLEADAVKMLPST